LLARRIERVAHLIEDGASATSRKACARRLRAASRAADLLDRRVRRLVDRGHVGLVDGGDGLRAAAAELGDRARALA
jgi:hypothetical protein